MATETYTSAHSSVCADEGGTQRNNVDTNVCRNKRLAFKGKDGLSFMITIWAMERLHRKEGSGGFPLNIIFDFQPE